MQSAPFLLNPTDTSPSRLRSDAGGHAPAQDAARGDLLPRDSFSSHLDRESAGGSGAAAAGTSDQNRSPDEATNPPAGIADEAQDAPVADDAAASGSVTVETSEDVDERPVADGRDPVDGADPEEASEVGVPQAQVMAPVAEPPRQTGEAAVQPVVPTGQSVAGAEQRLEDVRQSVTTLRDAAPAKPERLVSTASEQPVPARSTPPVNGNATADDEFEVPVNRSGDRVQREQRAVPSAAIAADATATEERKQAAARSEQVVRHGRGSSEGGHASREQARPEVNSSRQQSAPARPDARGPVTSLAALLDEYGGSSNGSGDGARQGAAVARAEQVQQAVALEQAAQLHHGARITPGSTQVMALEGASADARQDVLADLTARESARTALEDRTGKLAARALGALASQRGGAMTMRLDPPSIGELAVRMTVLDGTVRAEMTASSSAARLLIERSIDILRGTLEARGLRVDRLSVQGPGSGAEATTLRSEAQQQGGHSSGSGGARDDQSDDGRRDAAGRESRGRDGGQRGRRDDGGEGTRSFHETMQQD